MTNPLEPAHVIFPTGKIFLTEGWYTRKDLQEAINWFDNADAALLKSMEEISGEKRP